MLLGTLGAIVLGNVWSGKIVILAGDEVSLQLNEKRIFDLALSFD